MLTLASFKRQISQEGFTQGGQAGICSQQQGAAEPVSGQRCSILLQGGAIHIGGPLPSWIEPFQLLVGDMMKLEECHGVSHCPRQSLYHRGRHHGHQQASLRGQTASGWKIQCVPGLYRGTNRAEDITVEITAAGLEEMSAHILPRHKPWLRYRRT